MNGASCELEMTMHPTPLGRVPYGKKWPIVWRNTCLSPLLKRLEWVKRPSQSHWRRGVIISHFLFPPPFPRSPVNQVPYPSPGTDNSTPQSGRCHLSLACPWFGRRRSCRQCADDSLYMCIGASSAPPTPSIAAIVNSTFTFFFCFKPIGKGCWLLKVPTGFPLFIFFCCFLRV